MKKDLILLNHERIHLRQQLELLLLPFYLLYLGHYLVNLFRFKTHYLAYFNICFEKEAYVNERNMSYLAARKSFSWISYLKRTK